MEEGAAGAAVVAELAALELVYQAGLSGQLSGGNWGNKITDFEVGADFVELAAGSDRAFSE